jgi:hypothetical protein
MTTLLGRHQDDKWFTSQYPLAIDTLWDAHKTSQFLKPNRGNRKPLLQFLLQLKAQISPKMSKMQVG